MYKHKLLYGMLKLISILFIMAVLFAYITETRRSEFVKYWYFKRNLERVNQAVILYAQENDSEMPSALRWADLVKNNNQLVLKEDFITPMSYPGFGIYFNKTLENKSLSDIKGNTVVLFTAKGEWNSNGDMKYFREKSDNLKHSYVITLNGDIYKYRSKNDTFLRLKDSQVIDFDALYWE